MEMQKVPEAGYPIQGLPVAGLQRKLTLANLSFPIKLWRSLRMASRIVNEFQPQAVVGVGGYASGPVLYAAQSKGIPTLLQEQNSYAGLTNKILAKKAARICVADRKTILVLGGSLGARTLNLAMLKHMVDLEKEGYQVLWQSGKFYFKEMETALAAAGLAHIHLREFIREMDLAYSAADVIVSRAGALSVSELCLVGKPVIFIPSPNVAEDHQTKNATACVNQGAAVLLPDALAVEQFKNYIDELLQQAGKAQALATAIKKMAMPDAANALVTELELLLK
jgi:UDP-N-acetylglucosamine--N-acetylmuramyl-(pentapeptide) pyrophosphoryl-undecaprenol N-acetylglucosamine transferase